MIVMGHRGAAALEPENTLLSVERAIGIGVDAVEVDIRATRDNELAIIHDATIDRTTNGKGFVRDYTVEELKRFDAGKGQKIPTLQELIDFTRNRVNLFLELKDEGIEQRVADSVRKNDLYEKACVISFWHSMVKRVKALDAGIRTGVLIVGCPIDTHMAGSAGANALVMNYAFVSKEFVELAHHDNFEVHIWNIDDPRLLDRYTDMGVDGIASNNPQILVDHFK